MELSAVALLVVLVGLMSIGLPITWALGGACISAILLDPNLSLAMITQKIFTGCDNFAMLALPAFFFSRRYHGKRWIIWTSGFLCRFSGRMDFRWYFLGIYRCLCRFLQLFHGSSVATTVSDLAALCILKWLNEITLRIIRPRVKRLVVP